jgi:alkylation response protein AidB-like acyl-CoA dehydrogenase
VITQEPVTLDTFRARAREWFEANTPQGWEEALEHASEEAAVTFFQDWARKLHSGGFLVHHWPREFGGGGCTVAEQIVIQQELARANAPRPRYMTISLGHAAATLMEHGTAEQRELLNGIMTGEIWCQGFSEPNAGSDLASLQTRAVRHGDHYLVNGSKVWSSHAHRAGWCLLLCRTDPSVPKHHGISLLLLDMRTPGVEVRPIRQPSGSSEFCEIFLTDVRIPVDMLVGQENAGWKIAQTTLSTERAAQIIELLEGLRTTIGRLVVAARETQLGGGRTMADDDSFRQELAARAAEVEALGLLTERMLSGLIAYGKLGPESSVIKLYYSELLQRMMSLGVRVAGLPTHTDPLRQVDWSFTTGAWMIDYIHTWIWTISAGSNEIQRNIIGERVLGLPRGPR